MRGIPIDLLEDISTKEIRKSWPERFTVGVLELLAMLGWFVVGFAVVMLVVMAGVAILDWTGLDNKYGRDWYPFFVRFFAFIGLSATISTALTVGAARFAKWPLWWPLIDPGKR